MSEGLQGDPRAGSRHEASRRSSFPLALKTQKGNCFHGGFARSTFFKPADALEEWQPPWCTWDLGTTRSPPHGKSQTLGPAQGDRPLR